MSVAMPERRTAVLVGLFAVLLALAVFAFASASDRKGRVCVLEFVSLGDEPSQEWLAQAVPEIIVTVLTAREGPWELVEREQIGKHIRDLGSFLKASASRPIAVDVLLSGSVLQHGKTMRMTAKIIEPAGGAILGTAMVSGAPEQVFELADQLATLIGVKLKGVSQPSPSAQPIARAEPVQRAQPVYENPGLRAAQRAVLEGQPKRSPKPDKPAPTPPTKPEPIRLKPAPAVVAPPPRPPGAYELVQRGDAAAREGNFNEAEALYRQALRIDNEFVDAYLGLGNTYIDQEDYPRAMKVLRDALRIAPNNAYVYFHLAWLLGEVGRYEQAVKHYEQAAQQKPDYADAFINMGVLYDDYLNEDEKAVTCYEKYLELKGPRASEVRGWLEAIHPQG